MEERSFRFDEINFHGLITLLIKNLWVVVAFCISALLVYTSTARLNYTPVYTSEAVFMVGAKDSTSAYNSLTTTQSMATVFVEVFQSNVLREKIQDQMPETTFTGTINTRTIPETNLLVVTVTSEEPDISFRAMHILLENYESISDYLFSNAQLEVIKDPVVPTRPANPLNVQGKYPLVLMLAAVLSISGIVMIYVLRDTVKTPKAARRKLDARLLRTIDHEEKNKTLRAKLQRKNTAPLIANSLISKAFMEGNLSLCSAVEYRVRKKGLQVIMITSVGENEGKSTVAANLALAMAAKNKRVVLLDCDFRKPALHKILEIHQPHDRDLTAYLLQEGGDLENYLAESKKYGIRLGSSHSSGKSIVKILNNGRLQSLLQQLRSQVDYVIVDTPPMLAAADAETIAKMVDTAVLVARADYMPIKSINEGIARLKKVTPDLSGVVLNNYRTKLF
ncbi:MAG: CpsD/CapB family tyrosine-protein kinase [Oscillospiraceae bacterium]|nr:CpsD/CapB family tyrosine-protein kinase [Oscillospiraceae bacterium]